jgi:hypothetical protein
MVAEGGPDVLNSWGEELMNLVFSAITLSALLAACGEQSSNVGIIQLPPAVTRECTSIVDQLEADGLGAVWVGLGEVCAPCPVTRANELVVRISTTRISSRTLDMNIPHRLYLNQSRSVPLLLDNELRFSPVMQKRLGEIWSPSQKTLGFAVYFIGDSITRRVASL